MNERNDTLYERECCNCAFYDSSGSYCEHSDLYGSSRGPHDSCESFLTTEFFTHMSPLLDHEDMTENENDESKRMFRTFDRSL
jgi:hypothetical protein